MAVKPPDNDLLLARRYLLLLLTLLPLLVALFGFAVQQTELPNWPEAPFDPVVRGRILTRDQVVLAEGPSDHRRYPEGELAAHLVGFSGAPQPDGRYGLEGLEYTLDARLEAGESVTLTIDAGLQAAAETHLAEAVQASGASNGAVVMLDSSSGEILAAASYPTFDPNRQAEYPRDAITNRAFLQLYEPGSVMKPFVVAALLESGRLAPNEVIPAEMSHRVGDKVFRDVARHDPELVVADVLRYSSNVGMLHLTERFSPEELYRWLEHFRFGKPLDLTSAFTRSGILNPWQEWVPQDQASVTIGQGIATTALQLAAAYNIFATGGLYVPPRLLPDEPVPPATRVLSPEVALTVRNMLVYTVEASGLRQSRIPGVRVAGKTGTADIFDRATGRYIDGDYSLTFAGFFPAEAPRITMVVYLQKPDEGSTSTYVAAPLFRAIGSEVAARWQVGPPPTQVASRAVGGP